MKVEGGIELRIEHLTDRPRVLSSSPAVKKSTDLQNAISYFLNWLHLRESGIWRYWFKND